MSIQIVEESLSSLSSHIAIPISFNVRSVIDVARSAERFVLNEQRLDSSYVKDYDAVENPLTWTRFDTSNWTLFAAYIRRVRVGGAVIAFDSPEVDLLEGRRDLAVIWDLRVLPDHRGHGVGAALFQAAEEWARTRGCTELKVETQNINVPACRFYERQGCELRTVNRFAYPCLPGEVQLLWSKVLKRRL